MNHNRGLGKEGGAAEADGRVAVTTAEWAGRLEKGGGSGEPPLPCTGGHAEATPQDSWAELGKLPFS